MPKHSWLVVTHVISLKGGIASFPCNVLKPVPYLFLECLAGNQTVCLNAWQTIKLLYYDLLAMNQRLKR